MIPLKDNIPTNSPPLVTVALIVLNSLIFFYQLFLGYGDEYFVKRFGLIPTYLLYGDIYGSNHFESLITYQFLHGGFVHIIGNMLFLWIFGNNIEDALGHFKFLLFYLLSGTAGGVAHSFIQSTSILPLIGASASVSGVLGAYLFLFPKAKVSTLFFFFFIIQIINVPAVIFIVFWFIIQIINVPSGSSVAYLAHVVGFLTGIVLVLIMKKRTGYARY